MTNENGHKCWWDEELGIARGNVNGILTLESANGIHHDQDEIIEKYGEGADWLIDLSRMKKANSDARKKIAELSSDPRVGKFAFYGASIFIRTVVNFMMAAGHKDNVKHFRAEEEGLAWIREGD